MKSISSQIKFEKPNFYDFLWPWNCWNFNDFELILVSKSHF